MAGEQDGAQTVDKARFDGLMASMNREKARADAAEARLAEREEPADDGGEPAGEVVDDSEAQDEDGGDADTGDSQQAEPEFEEGITYVFEGGKFRPVEPPTPTSHNESRTRDNRVWDGPDYPLKGTSPAGEGFPI